MENEAIMTKLVELEAKIDATHAAAQKTYRIMYWTGVISIAVIVLPIILMFFFLPSFFRAEGIDSTTFQSLQGL